MSDDSVSERMPAWAPEEVDALFEAARGARRTAQRAVEESREAMWRRKDAHRRYARMVAAVQRSYAKRG